VEEAKVMAAEGVRELNLVAQDLTEYGMEWKYKENLEMLLPELCKVEGIEWIRLHYVYPDQFSDELVEIIAREPKIVKYLDMPIQHTNDRVLGLMNRRLTKAKLYDLMGKLRAKIPGLVIRTSIIVGFPSETDAEFQELCDDLEKLNLDHVGVFSYSKEEGTKAAEMDGQLHANVKRKRRKALIEMLQRQRGSKLSGLIGSQVQVMVEGSAEETALLIQARMPTQAQEIDGRVLINDLGTNEGLALNPGDLATVEITELADMDLVAKLVRVEKPAIQQTAGLTTRISKGLEMRSGSVAH
jgi:ribosomal protein S12 methylthiotransferase